MMLRRPGAERGSSDEVEGINEKVQTHMLVQLADIAAWVEQVMMQALGV